MYKQLNKDSFYYGFPVALLTTVDTKLNHHNVTPISSVWTLDKTVVLGLGLNNQALFNIQAGSHMTLNLPDASLWEQIEKIAKTTANPSPPPYKVERGFQYEPDKFTIGQFTTTEGFTVASLGIKECPIQIELISTNISHRDGFAIVEASIQTILVEESLLSNESHIDVSKWQPLIYKFRSYTSTTEVLGTNFRFEEGGI